MGFWIAWCTVTGLGAVLFIYTGLTYRDPWARNEAPIDVIKRKWKGE